MYAIVRIRGTVSVSPKVERTLEHLNLKRVNNASIWQESNEVLRMIKLVEHMVTYGKINDATLKNLIEKKGQAIDGKFDAKKVLEELKKGKSANEAGVVNCFRLSPPKKGFERKGIKKPYTLGGAHGDRAEEIGELIERMIQ